MGLNLNKNDLDKFIDKNGKKDKGTSRTNSNDTTKEYLKNVDEKLKQTIASDMLYQKIALKITDSSINQLYIQNNFKRYSRKYFIGFFSLFVSVEYVMLMVMIFRDINISQTTLNTYMVSVFVETLGVIASMTKFVFDSAQEGYILNVINSILKNFKKFNENDNTSDKSDKDEK